MNTLFYKSSVKPLLCIIINLIVALISQSSFARSADSGHYSSRDGQELYFHWVHTTMNNEEIEFDLYVHLGPDFELMQKRYRACNHDHGRYRENILFDPFYNVVKVVAEVLIQKARAANVSPCELALSFVQSLDYAENMNYYQRQSSETLVDRTGDCSDKAVLYAGLLYFMNIDCVFLEYPTHLMTAIWLTGQPEGIYFLHKGKRYYMCEQTGGAHKIGDCWGEYCNAQAKIIDLY